MGELNVTKEVVAAAASVYSTVDEILKLFIMTRLTRKKGPQTPRTVAGRASWDRGSVAASSRGPTSKPQGKPQGEHEQHGQHSSLTLLWLARENLL